MYKTLVKSIFFGFLIGMFINLIRIMINWIRVFILGDGALSMNYLIVRFSTQCLNFLVYGFIGALLGGCLYFLLKNQTE